MHVPPQFDPLDGHTPESRQPPDARQVLSVGPMVIEFGGGELRYGRLDGIEVVRRWYAAVRDQNWGTVPATLQPAKIVERPDGLSISFAMEHRQQQVAFDWTGHIDIDASSIRFTLDGVAQSTFLRNRIGFCILHPPATCAGSKCQCIQADGSIISDAFPDLVAPDNPFHDLAGISHNAGAYRAHWSFEGDLFETEDQRNWIDASFKTFCTPLSRPFPVEVTAGAKVRQVVTLRWERIT
jgi:D-apionolactonase